MISVLVADDHSVVREGIRRVIETEMDIKVCAEAENGRQVLEEIERHRPDVVILDINMPEMGGLESLERIRSSRSGIKVVLLSVRSDAPVVQSAVSLGTDGYVLKTARTSDIIDAIRAVHGGGSYFSPTIAKEIVDQIRGPQNEAEPFRTLSPREREVLCLIAEGRSAKEIASDLHISSKTVEAHRTSLTRKLGVRKATELVRYAIRHGLVDP
ncbi:MAG: response regulator transcription factor [Myxococcales bacterium]|nr:response regulator transcription factor [Myxococcales bacterium]